MIDARGRVVDPDDEEPWDSKARLRCEECSAFISGEALVRRRIVGEPEYESVYVSAVLHCKRCGHDAYLWDGYEPYVKTEYGLDEPPLEEPA